MNSPLNIGIPTESMSLTLFYLKCQDDGCPQSLMNWVENRIEDVVYLEMKCDEYVDPHRRDYNHLLICLHHEGNNINLVLKSWEDSRRNA